MSEPTPIQRLMADIQSIAEQERQWPFTVQIPRSRAAEFADMSLEEWQKFALDTSREEIAERLSRGTLALNGLEIAGVRLVVAERDEDDCDTVKCLDEYD